MATGQESGLPLSYDPEILREYFDRLPGLQFQRRMGEIDLEDHSIPTISWEIDGNTLVFEVRMDGCINLYHGLVPLGPFSQFFGCEVS